MYTKALEIEPSNSLIVLTLLHGRANAKANVGNFHEAIDDCTQALNIDSSSVAVRLLRAQCYHYLDEFQASINDYELAECATELQNDPKKWAEVQSKVATIKIEMNRKRAEVCNVNGNEEMCLQNYYAAERQYAEAIALWPNNLIFYGNHCVSLMKQGKLKRALLDCQQIIKINPNSRRGHEFQAKCYQIYGDYDGADQVAINLETIESHSSNRIKDLNVELRQHQRLAIQYFEDRNFLSARKHTK